MTFVQCNADKTGHHLKSSAKNMQGNGQPLKSWACFRDTGHLISAPKD